MTVYSKYRAHRGLSDNAKAIICAIAICLLWGFVSEMDYRKIEQQRCERVA